MVRVVYCVSQLNNKKSDLVSARMFSIFQANNFGPVVPNPKTKSHLRSDKIFLEGRVV